MLCAAAAISLPAQTFNTLYNFSSAGYSQVNELGGPLLQAADGNLFGTVATEEYFGGSIFKITPEGVFTSLYGFRGDGGEPDAPLIQAGNGDLYGETFGTGYGIIFKLTPENAFTSLFSFDGGAHDAYPWGGLIQAADGDLYGITLLTEFFPGTIFKITQAGALTTLYTFPTSEGGPTGSLVQAPNGDFYGTTSTTGPQNGPSTQVGGTFFKMTPDGTLTTLYSFDSMTEGLPYGPLVEGPDGNFYGTSIGVNSDRGAIFRITPAGS